MSSSKSKLLVFRNIVRLFFIFSFFVLAEVTEEFMGTEIEFENEYIVLLAILIFGTFWCGWFCPFGNVQYIAGKIGKKWLSKYQLSIPGKVDKGLRFLKFFFLAMFLFIFMTGTIGYFDDHEAMYESRWYSNLFLMIKKPWAIFLIPLFIPRFFCKYMCYQKAMYQVINRICPTLAIRRDTAACTSCNKCSTDCPMDIDIANVQRISGGEMELGAARAEKISGSECIGCFSCVDETGCPTAPSSLYLTWFGKKVSPMKLSFAVVMVYCVATAVMLFGFGSLH